MCKVELHVCYLTKQPYYPPTPIEQPCARVDTREYPEEMGNAVILLKGSKCIASDCSKQADTLDHMYPWSKGGYTSVNNLFPMCEEHNKAKNAKNPEYWLIEQLFSSRPLI